MEYTDDDFWVHRTLWICALVLQRAFGGNPIVSRWHELRQLIDEWENLRPKSFDPLFYRLSDPDDDRWYSEICYATDEYGNSTPTE
ncbi:hypothetical protein MMC28_011590 [Mycoblastus sanguinarius]|nr:hypothetical protein [Mycoblastus sanguinarius]